MTVLTPMGPISAHTLGKQRSTIEMFIADNRRLKEELQEENVYRANPTRTAAKTLIRNLEAQDLLYEKLIADEQSAMEALMSKESTLRAGIATARAEMGGVNRALELSVREQRQVILLENRVEQAAAALGAAQVTAGQLKEKIDGLRRERRLFDELTEKIGRALVAKAETISEMLARTVAAHGARGKAEAMKAQVLARAEKDAAAGEAEWRQLTAVIENDRARKEAERAEKTRRRSERMADLLKKHRLVAGGRDMYRSEAVGNKGIDGPEYSSADNADRGESSSASDPSSVFTALEPTMTANNMQPREQLARIEQMLANVVSEIPGCGTIEDVIDGIAELRQLCFRLFTSLAESHARIESLEDGLQHAKAAAAAVTSGTTQLPPVMDEAEERSKEPETEDTEEVAHGSQVDDTRASITDTQLDVIGQQILALCTAFRHVCPEVDVALNELMPSTKARDTANALLQYVAFLEQISGAVMSQVSTTSSVNTPSSNSKVNRQLESMGLGGPTMVLDPPSVAMSDSTSVRDGLGMMTTNMNSQAGRRVEGGKGRPSGASSVSAGAESQVLSLATLTQRAQKAVSARLGMAAAMVATTVQREGRG